MKRFLRIMSVVLLILGMMGCGSTEQQPTTDPKVYDFNGNWYSVKDGYLYVFTNGDVFCEENHLTSLDGEKTSGGYIQHDDYIEAYVIEMIGGSELAPLYLVRGKYGDSLCTDEEGEKVIFCRDKDAAQTIVQQRAERDEQQLAQEIFEEQNSIRTSPLVEYDVAVSGDFTNQYVKIEGFITSFEHPTYMSWYDIDFGCWSSQQGSYICKSITIFDDQYTAEDIDQISNLSVGDKVNFVFVVKPEGKFGDWLDVPQYLHIELIEKNAPESQEIEYPTESEETTATTELVSEERIVYITSSGSKYHTKNCRWTSDSCIEISYEEAKRRGYTPCGTCNPLP